MTHGERMSRAVDDQFKEETQRTLRTWSGRSRNQRRTTTNHTNYTNALFGCSHSIRPEKSMHDFEKAKYAAQKHLVGEADSMFLP
jgi:hypothetical protein